MSVIHGWQAAKLGLMGIGPFENVLDAQVWLGPASFFCGVCVSWLLLLHYHAGVFAWLAASMGQGESMARKRLKPWQARIINRALYPGFNYLGRLRERMVKVGFLPDDPLMQLVERAYDAMHALSVKTHYLSCESGVGMEPIEDRQD